MAELIPLMDWERGVQVGWWQEVGPTRLEEGLEVDWWFWREVDRAAWRWESPVAQAAVDGQEWEKVGKGGGSPPHKSQEGDNVVQNLEMVLGRDHRRHHGRLRRARPRW